ncbi:MAG: MetQ/NlpA family ABC transporter substrate-binding protein [Christensenellales bacterium]|jgi:D-methionine transport system substrate-binding protein
MKKMLSLAIALCMMLALPAASAITPLTITIGIPPASHMEILELVREDLAALGYQLKFIVYAQDELINPSLSAEEMDASYGRGLAPMIEYNSYAGQAEQLVAVIPVHFAPYGLYTGGVSSLDDLKEGGVIAIPDDPEGETRALLLLAEAGLIVLPDDAPTADLLTLSDILENPRNLDIRKVDAPKLSDADLTVLSAESAKAAGLKPVFDAVFFEPPGSASALRYAAYVVVLYKNADAEFTNALRQVLLTQKVYDFILTNDDYDGALAPAFAITDENE